MKNLEKQIEEAAKNNCNLLGGGEEDDYSYNHVLDAFYNGVKSPEAKEYWQQGIYTEEEVRVIARKAFNQAISFFHIESNNSADFRFNTWWEQNKKK